MALRVISSTLTDRNGTVIIGGDTQEEVMSGDAKRLAINEASTKISRAGVSGNEVAYPVDANGQTPDDLVLGRNGARVVGYHCAYRVTGGL